MTMIRPTTVRNTPSRTAFVASVGSSGRASNRSILVLAIAITAAAKWKRTRTTKTTILITAARTIDMIVKGTSFGPLVMP